MNYGLAQANMAAIGGGSYNRYSTAGVGGSGSVGNSGMVTSKQGLATSAGENNRSNVTIAGPRYKFKLMF